MRPARLRLGVRAAAAALAAALAAGCGATTTRLIRVPEPTTTGVQAKTPQAGQKLGFPAVATKNTTRVSGADPVADAAGVALAVYPSSGAGTHPAAVTLAPTDSWQGALAASVLMAAPVRAPILLSGSEALPSATADAVKVLAPAGSGATAGAQVLRVGDVPAPAGLKSTSISGTGPFALAAAIDRFISAAAGQPSPDVVVASADDPAYAMPAAGWAAESGNPVLFVSKSRVPPATRQALLSHQRPHIYALGPPSVISNAVLGQLAAYGPVKRVGAVGAAANSVAFAAYRDPPCVSGQACVHVPGSFGWALRSPGHGYTLIDARRPLDAAAAAPLSASGSFGPELVIDNASTLSPAVLNYFLDYATPGYTQEGPTAAVYNHGWVIGDQSAISIPVQAEVDSLLEAIPQR
ncbi:MAG: cell wall-binding repeat-containing protein [Solirubrobacterales bacterium]|nr:cell wall-binding repeat-containing protein [Solirubrobacterales bacterium]MBV9715428.1 cell wall-binding repeat-containing protein [Solirubrobacterales bacterium]